MKLEIKQINYVVFDDSHTKKCLIYRDYSINLRLLNQLTIFEK